MSATAVDFPRPASEHEAAVYRWTLGHRAFHLYLIAMVTLLAELDRAEAPDEARTTCILRDLATLFEATSACMKYSSDFEPDVYDSAIRPSMEPPMCKPGFSGSLNVDHKRMTVALVGVPELLARRFGEDMAAWSVPVREAWQSLVEAEQRARFDHGHICRRLVPSGPSLLRLHRLAEKDSGRPPEV